MCAVNGILDFTQPHDLQVVSRMNLATRHRGPDHQGVVQVKSNTFFLTIGNNRLNVTDRDPNSNQPLISDDGNYILSFNGEIYNYADLKNTLLQLGYRFKSSSDTEVLLYSLIEYGKDCLPRLNGMFAFLFADLKNNFLLAARDSSGMKKLYYHQQADRWIFSSEVKGILASGLVTKKPNPDQFDYYLLFNYTRPPETFFEGIKELLPGEFLQIKNLDCTFGCLKFDQSGNHNLAMNEQKPMLNQLEEILINSIYRHCETPYPFGILLSGGVDSTLILALVSKHLQNFIPTFTVVPSVSDQKFATSDYLYSRKAAKKYNSDHFELELKPDLNEDLLAFIKDTDHPVGDIAAFLTYMITRETNSKVRVMLSGAGADEYFAGYNRYQGFRYYLRYPWLKKILSGIKPVTNSLPQYSTTFWGEKARILRQISDSYGHDEASTFINLLTNNFPQLRKEKTLLIDGEMSSLEDLLRHDRQNFLVHDILAINDYYGMRHQVEIRAPFLDRELLHASRSLNGEFLLQNGNKWLLKEVLRKYDGLEFCKRRKEGFGIPFGRNIIEDRHSNWMKFLRAKERGCYEYVDYKLVQYTLDQHLKVKSNYSRELWSVMLLVAWFEKEFGNEDRLYSSIL